MLLQCTFGGNWTHWGNSPRDVWLNIVSSFIQIFVVCSKNACIFKQSA